MTPLILIADALDAYRERLRHQLEDHSSAWRIAEVASMAELLEAWPDLHPDVVLLDTSLKDARGLRSALDLQESMPGSSIILLSKYDDDPLRQAAVRIGIAGVVNKIHIRKEILPLVEKVLNAGTSNGEHPTSKGGEFRFTG